jgi:hypothetical protein
MGDDRAGTDIGFVSRKSIFVGYQYLRQFDFIPPLPPFVAFV